MARSNARFKRAFNGLLEIAGERDVGQELGSEPYLAARLDVSRTTVRAALKLLESERLLHWSGRRKIILRRPTPADRFPETETSTAAERLENRFLDWIVRQDIPPDTPLRVSELARQFGVAASLINEYLATVARFGLIERRGTRGWIMRGFTPDYANELFDFRLMVELNSVRHLVALPTDHDIWRQLDELADEHRLLVAEIAERYHDFSELDGRLHAAVNAVTVNRFTQAFQNIISLIFHYHYQWNKLDERERNEAAIYEHLDYIDALRSRDVVLAEAAARRHLNTARETLLKSIGAL